MTQSSVAQSECCVIAISSAASSIMDTALTAQSLDYFAQDTSKR